jgi:Ni,Fe-hydrogenase maturation factor
MTRVLIAGVGNVCFGDDAFGVEVARELAHARPPDAKPTTLTRSVTSRTHMR